MGNPALEDLARRVEDLQKRVAAAEIKMAELRGSPISTEAQANDEAQSDLGQRQHPEEEEEQQQQQQQQQHEQHEQEEYQQPQEQPEEAEEQHEQQQQQQQQQQQHEQQQQQQQHDMQSFPEHHQDAGEPPTQDFDLDAEAMQPDLQPENRGAEEEDETLADVSFGMQDVALGDGEDAFFNNFDEQAQNTNVAPGQPPQQQLQQQQQEPQEGQPVELAGGLDEDETEVDNFLNDGDGDTFWETMQTEAENINEPEAVAGEEEGGDGGGWFDDDGDDLGLSGV